MALTIEDGTGVAGADSFETVAECSSFATLYYGHSLTGSEAEKEASLRRAFYYMQALQWKDGLWPTFGGAIPDAVKHAQTLFARAEHKAAGTLSPMTASGARKLLTGVDSLKWSVIGDDASVQGTRPIVTAAFDFLRPYLDYDPARDKSVGYTGAMVV